MGIDINACVFYGSEYFGDEDLEDIKFPEGYGYCEVGSYYGSEPIRKFIVREYFDVDPSYRYHKELPTSNVSSKVFLLDVGRLVHDEPSWHIGLLIS